MSRLVRAAALALVLVARTARAGDDEPTALPEAAMTGAASPPVPFSFRLPSGWYNLPSRLGASGYILPQFELVSIRSALPRDKTQYGARGTRAGFALYGTPWTDFTYVAHFVVAPAGVENVTLLSPSASPSIGFTIPTTTGSTIDFEEVSLAYRPKPWVFVKAGFVRLPFSLGQMTPIPEQMFPFRPSVTSEFQSGADASLLGSFHLLDEKLTLNAAAFLGASLGGAVSSNQSVRGPAFLASVVAEPLGPMSTREGTESRGPLRVALAVSTIYRRATAFDPTGYEASHFDDVRLAGWARASYRYFYVQGEYLRRNRNDDVSGRPNRSEGFYAEASYFVPVRGWGLGPIARAGQVRTSAEFAPRLFRSLEAGIAVYPYAGVQEPERLRFVFEYFLARTSPLDETQHEGLAQVQLEF